MSYHIVNLSSIPERRTELARWFHEKWGIPMKAYLESMDESLRASGAVPQWYAAVENGRFIGGAGVIQNDFHDRKDLAPNVCAVYVEPDCRGRGVAGALLDYICRDMKTRGVGTLYLVTDHDSFYERYGWEFLCPVQGDGEPQESRMYVRKT